MSKNAKKKQFFIRKMSKKCIKVWKLYLNSLSFAFKLVTGRKSFIFHFSSSSAPHHWVSAIFIFLFSYKLESFSLIFSTWQDEIWYFIILIHYLCSSVMGFVDIKVIKIFLSYQKIFLSYFFWEKLIFLEEEKSIKFFTNMGYVLRLCWGIFLRAILRTLAWNFFIHIYDQIGNLFKVSLKFHKLIFISFMCISCRHKTGVKIMSL